MAVLGLGLAALGRPGYMTLGHALDFPDASREALERRTHALLDAAYAAGVRHVDAARSYGDAEAFLSSWLSSRAHWDLTVSSKWGYRYTASWQRDATVHEVKELSLRHFDEQWPQSQALLGRWLAVYQVHSATLESGLFEDRALLERLSALSASGVAAGLSVTGPRQPDVISAATRAVDAQGRRVFSWVQATWNLLEPSAGPALAEAHALGLTVIVKEALANGRLSPRGGCTPLLDLARQSGSSADTLALGAALQQPWADVVLSGATTLEQLESNLKARSVRIPPLPVISLAPSLYWAQRADLAWS